MQADVSICTVHQVLHSSDYLFFGKKWSILELNKNFPLYFAKKYVVVTLNKKHTCHNHINTVIQPLFIDFSGSLVH